MSPSNAGTAGKVAKQRILFMMSGSIAAFKACALLSKLVQAGHEVQVVASSAALKFVGAATLEGLSGRPVMSDLWESGHAMDHIHAVRWADLLVVIPASAHFINRIAAGVGDDLLTTMFLAHDFKKPLLIAPAMNTSMYLHPATQASLATLREWGVKILEAASGVLACGEQGYGRLLEPADLMIEIENELRGLRAHPDATTPSLARALAPVNTLRVLVTAGGTVEPLDGVRVLANESTGQTGLRIAAELREAGLDVTLLSAVRASSKTSFGSGLAGDRQKSFRTFGDLEALVKNELETSHYDFVIQAAAVSDYRLAEILVDGHKPAAGKIPSGSELNLKLTPNPKLIDQFKMWSKNKDVKVLGFKFTDNADDAQKGTAVAKLIQRSAVDWVLWNDTRGIDRENGHHVFEILDKNTVVLESGTESGELAPAILRLILMSSQNSEKLSTGDKK